MIDIRLDDFYEEQLKKLQSHHREASATPVVRMLIREASMSAGLWPNQNGHSIEEDEDNQLANAGQLT